MRVRESKLETSTPGFPDPIGALYLHVPFCVKRCAYCDFASSALGEGRCDRTGDYVRALSSLLEELSTLGLLAGLRTAYVGGGTPTVLGEGLPELIGTVVASAAHPLDELTFEANPDSSSRELLDACRETGATRVSFGVQSTDDAVLRKLGRLHDARQALDAIGGAREAGLRTSADLMAGVPGQVPGSLRADVARLADAGVGHVSVYALEIHEDTPFGRLEAEGRLHAPDEDETADLLEEAEEALRSAGYDRYEISNYARPGERSRHNLAYWTTVPYLGLGPSAASMLNSETYRAMREIHPGLPDLPESITRVRLTCTSTIDEMLEARTFSDLFFEVEGLTSRQSLAEDLMLQARLSSGFDPALLTSARTEWGSELDALLDRMVSRGLLERPQDNRLASQSPFRPTHRGWLMGNLLFSELWSLAGDTTTWVSSTR